MGLTVNRQNQLDKLFEKFAVDPIQPPKKKTDATKTEKKETKKK
ncbi:SPJ_0845 family protein [Liquorilactobacillus capillatus]|nr:SPJ_0845 family protein [Liquorilactobacillus capillatus]